MHSIRRNLAFGGVMAVAAAALAGCAGGPEDPASSTQPPVESEGSIASSRDQAVARMDELGGEAVHTMTGEASDDSVRSKAGFSARLTDIETAEAHVFCDSFDAPLRLTVNGEELEVACHGPEEPQIIELMTENFVAGEETEVQLDSSDMPEGDTYGVVIRVVES